MRLDRAICSLVPQVIIQVIAYWFNGKTECFGVKKIGTCPTDVVWQHGMMVTKGNHPHGMFFPWCQDQNREKDGCVFGISLVRFLWIMRWDNTVFHMG